MTSLAAIRGYLLEEALAWLVRTSGYRLLVNVQDDPDGALTSAGNGLLVKGRGANHQADTLGEFAFVPPFSLPIRLFVEAKFRNETTGIYDVRNAFGVISDVNENYVQLDPGRRPRRRYRYVYTLFSTSGFSTPAQEYAIAHQISLVDLSGDTFAWLRRTVAIAADRVYSLEQSLKSRSAKASIPRAKLREIVRRQLETTDSTQVGISTPSWWSEDIDDALAQVASDLGYGLRTAEGRELLLGFPPAPFVLTLTAQSPYTMEHFLAFTQHRPRHAIGLRRRRADSHVTQWELFPRESPDAYRLSFTLPDRVEEWIDDSERYRMRARIVEESLLSTIVLYRLDQGAVTVYQLDYEPAELRPMD
ncbi:hypothetical protein Daura_48555 [Dactylosporangium aurantiacum]|uniref:Restriction endonuclease type IV Mrr domain-containing protein n=1 Tax=Dactylosporangium aurantiacum TaxID=35754 RepID=A0A9Q9MCQ0_9ACTN|nr:hypothetical protein [Dactylosporangium aurantiacum]MDG6109613.1 hypothetical protein [Dactylosporangium aurantiacum]UWZ54233.1 hypothetical protein Daura_48555 [Dactylosporangium aurantiacum]